MENKLKYRADIDGLRAVAVLLVLVFHFDLFSVGKAGFIGVDVFFVISGFLITTIVKNQLDDGSFSFGQFYMRRIRRLVPALIAVLILTLLFGYFFLFPKAFDELTNQVLTTQFYGSNVYYWQNLNYFGLRASSTFLLHTWSLAVEEQFYLVFPFVLFLIHRYKVSLFWSAIVFGVLISFAINIYFVKIKPEATFFLMPPRAWEFLAGSLILLFSGLLIKRKLIRECISLIGVVLIILSVTLFNKNVYFPGFFALLPVLGAVFVILAGCGEGSVVSKLLSTKPLIYIGKISYSLYLVHWPINVYAGMILGAGYSKAWHFAMFGFSFLLAAMLYHFVEQPFRSKRLVKSNKQFVIFYLSTLALTILLFAYSKYSDGIPTRFPDEVSKIVSYQNDMPPNEGCEYEGQVIRDESDFCHIGLKDKNPTWLMFGDSHSWAAKAIFDEWLKVNNQSGLFIFRNSCPPVKGVYLFRRHSVCFKLNQNVYQYASDHSEIKNIILVSTWLQADAMSNTSEKKLSKVGALEFFTRQFKISLNELYDAGKNVFIWEPVPHAKGDVPKGIAKAMLRGKKIDLEYTIQEYKQNYNFFFKMLDDNAEKIYFRFSPSQALCSENQRCKVLVNNIPVYYDNGHLTQSLNDFWVNALNRQYQPD